MRSKTDARQLDPTRLARLRRSVVQAVRGGMSQIHASQVFGVSLRAASKWVALDRSGGLRALKLKRRGRRVGGGRLNPARAKRIHQLIIDTLPDQLMLPLYLWTRAAVISLIEREYDITVSATSVGRYLKSWGMSPQKPAHRACERSDAAMTRWLRLEYPTLARQARQQKAVIFWGDELALRCARAAGTSYTLLGHTPPVRATGQRFGCNMIFAITNRGHLAFMVFYVKFDGSLFVQFMQRLLRQASGKIYLIVDGHPVHRSNIVKRFVAANAERLRMISLPDHRPKLNQDVKSNGLGKSRPTNRTEMMTSVRSHLQRRQRQPPVVRSHYQ